MKLEEFQAKSLFADFGIPVTRGVVATTPGDAVKAAEQIGLPVVVKAQVQAGGRGKAGGVRLARDPGEVASHASAVLGMKIRGLPVERVLVDPAVPIRSEYYAGITIDRRSRTPVLMASSSGGVDIEEVARVSPGKIVFHPVDPGWGLREFEAREVALRIFREKDKAFEAASVLLGLWRCFSDCDASLAEINPLVELDDGSILAIDAKVELDDNALFRHPALEGIRLAGADEKKELEARANGLSYVRLDGDIGCMVNGAGLAMCTMDEIKRLGGSPANFLDIGGSSSPAKVVHAMRLLTGDSSVRSIFINVFGGITRCDDVARGLVEALSQIDTALPIVVRLTGTNEAEGRAILAGEGIDAVGDMTEGARRAIARASGGEAAR